MTEQDAIDRFERRLGALVRAQTNAAARAIDALELARTAMGSEGLETTPSRARTGLGPFDRRLAWLLVLGALALAIGAVLSAIGAARPTSTIPAEGQIAFLRQGQGLFIARGDGSNERLVARFPAEIDLPLAWSPSGRFVAVTRREIGGSARVVDIRTQDGALVSTISPAESWAWAPNIDRLAVTNIYDPASGEPLPSSERRLAIVNADGSVERTIGIAFLGEAVLGWSADGRWVLVPGCQVPEGAASCDIKTDRQELFLVAADGSAVTPLTDTPRVPEKDVAWSPDDARVAYTDQLTECPATDVECEITLWIAGADGSDPRKVTSSTLGLGNLIWSADGSSLLFSQFTKLAAAGSDPQDLADPVYGSQNLYVLDADGSIRQLTTFTDRGAWPIAYSQDGRLILFARSRAAQDQTVDMWAMDADGTQQRRLLVGTGIAAWQWPTNQTP
ncbi:MAG: TolB family protein [Candidatus Limnocylindrales bacterium]